MVDAKNGRFQLQARTKLTKAGGSATVFSAAVAKELNASAVQVSLKEEGLYWTNNFCVFFVLFCFVLFCFVLFYFILFYFILFYFILFYFILFYFILFYFILFYFILFYFILFYSFLLISSLGFNVHDSLFCRGLKSVGRWRRISRLRDSNKH